MNRAGRLATDADVGELAAMNRQLIRDEGHSNATSLEQLAVGTLTNRAGSDRPKLCQAGA